MTWCVLACFKSSQSPQTGVGGRKTPGYYVRFLTIHPSAAQKSKNDTYVLSEGRVKRAPNGSLPSPTSETTKSSSETLTQCSLPLRGLTKSPRGFVTPRSPSETLKVELGNTSSVFPYSPNERKEIRSELIAPHSQRKESNNNSLRLGAPAVRE